MTHTGIDVLTNVLIGDLDEEILALEADIRAAQLAADVVALDRLISDDLLFTGPDGNLATKEQDIAAHRSGLFRICEHNPLEIRIRRVGTDVAIVALLARMAADVNGSLVRGTFRYTRVWAREHGSWRVAGGHVAPVPDESSASS